MTHSRWEQALRQGRDAAVGWSSWSREVCSPVHTRGWTEAGIWAGPMGRFTLIPLDPKTWQALPFLSTACLALPRPATRKTIEPVSGGPAAEAQQSFQSRRGFA